MLAAFVDEINECWLHWSTKIHECWLLLSWRKCTNADWLVKIHECWPSGENARILAAFVDEKTPEGWLLWLKKYARKLAGWLKKKNLTCVKTKEAFAFRKLILLAILLYEQYIHLTQTSLHPNTQYLRDQKYAYLSFFSYFQGWFGLRPSGALGEF